jgi:hypothetical protein
MTVLVSALYAEGRTDERFLPVIIRRTVEQILIQRGRTTVDVLEPIVLNHTIGRDFPRRDERILEAARRSHGFHVLIVHADADHPTPDRAFNERIQPGFDLVQQAREGVCDQLIPIIPVQMTEAWMLTDPEALRTVIGIHTHMHNLGLPARASQVESDPDPKQTLSQIVQNALTNRPHRRRRIKMGTIYEPLAQEIRLERLNTVSAYQQFVNEMTRALVTLHLAE